MKKRPLVECVPNVSEGRNTKVLDTLASAIEAVQGVALLDRHTDADHHRSVFTFAGDPHAVAQAAFACIQRAVSLLDIRKHRGVHPRVGVVDVVPFVPLHHVEMAECIRLARELAARVGTELSVPVFLYEEACRVPARRRLETIRRGGLEGVAQRMQTDPLWRPDYGPARPHPTAGVMVVGARSILIAFNVVLDTDDLAAAQSIAKTIRTSGGGLPALKAIGVALASRGRVQIAMNVTNFRETSLVDAFQAVQREAERRGLSILESELVGLVPRAALPPDPTATLKLRHWRPEQVLETRLTQAGLLTDDESLTLEWAPE